METLCFRLPGHGDSTLKHMDSLRSRQHFCDITIMSSDNQIFRGHKVVLAACSPYLRDQFLLNPSSKLQVSMLYSSSVVGDLLLSCYTGVLQFNSKEIVNYLTAASYLQMEHIVERCRGALKKYIQLKNLSSPKEEGHSSPVIVSGSVVSVGAGPSPKQPSTPEAHGSRQFQMERWTNSRRGHHHWRGGNYELRPAEEQPGGSNQAVENLRFAIRHRLSELKPSKGRGRGFKRKKWMSSEEKRLLGLANQQDMWYVTNSGVGLAFGSEYNQDTLKPGSYISVELPQLDYNVGEGQGGGDRQVAQFALEEAGGGDGGEGALAVQPSEGAGGGDESVAVVGSTSSSVSGAVICDYCGLAFPTANILAIHCRTTHMLYACPCCGKKFHHSANLSRHMAVHRTTGKSHPCPLCCKSFTQKSTLIDHMNLHSGEKPHRCAYCHARFAHKPALRRHLKEQHGKTTVQNSLEQQERDRREAQQGVEQN
uniref:Zinc finger and BTB domain containing 12, tandem duplicate 1 n=1 Tax=Neogobius melanostomus TaxID=47308 RepID=A0A8C6SUD8_9GOBI